MATIVHTSKVEFIQADLLSADFATLGTFDTVTAIHLLEHIPEALLPLALTHLLAVTKQRLLIAVPYEEQPETAYGHEQVFTPEKLEGWGTWCIEQLGGKGKAFCEEVMGGLLVVERYA